MRDVGDTLKISEGGVFTILHEYAFAHFWEHVVDDSKCHLGEMEKLISCNT